MPLGHDEIIIINVSDRDYEERMTAHADEASAARALADAFGVEGCDPDRLSAELLLEIECEYESSGFKALNIQVMNRDTLELRRFEPDPEPESSPSI